MVSKKKRLSAAERRAQLIGVGRKVFSERGYEATSVEVLAARAKVSKPVLYEHFGGKEGLYAVVVDREIETVVARISGAIQTGTPRERMEQAIAAFMGYVKDEPDGFAILCHDSPIAVSGGGMSSLLSTVAQRVGDVFTEMFKAAGYAPKFAPIYAQALIGMVTFVGQWWTETKSPSVDTVASHLSALAWMGLRHLPDKPDTVSTKRRGS
jgi:AcrR family transcriptional regulator